MNNGTLLLSRDNVERLLRPDACIAAVEDAFRQLGLGQVAAAIGVYRAALNAGAGTKFTFS